MSDKKIGNTAIGSVSEAEIKAIRKTRSGESILNISRMMASQKKFDVGDVLVVKNIRSRSDGQPAYEYMMNSQIPQKYVVVFKDEADIIYCKRIVSNGTLGKGVIMPATWHSGSWEFIMDPDQADSIICGQDEKYNPIATVKLLRKRKEEIKKYNKTIEIKFNNMLEANEWIATVKVSDTIWSTSSYTDPKPRQGVVLEVRSEYINKQINNYRQEPQDQNFIDAGITSIKNYFTLKRDINHSWTSKIDASELKNNYYKLFKMKPQVVDSL